jgi:hypothetical protein
MTASETFVDVILREEFVAWMERSPHDRLPGMHAAVVTAQASYRDGHTVNEALDAAKEVYRHSDRRRRPRR